MSQIYQAVIVGGGLIGSAMACSLGSKPHLFKRILLLDGGPSTPKNNPVAAPFQNRVLAVNPASQELLRTLGVWNELNTFPVNRMVVWDSKSNSKIQFEGEICSIAENQKIIDSLHHKISQNSEITFQNNVKIVKCDLPHEEGRPVNLKLNDGTSISSELVIGADGINSIVREATCSKTLKANYEQFGLVATLKFRDISPNLGTAYQKFLPTGPIALLPLDKEHCSLVWTLPSHKAKEYMALNDEDFLYKLNTILSKVSEPSVINEVNRCFDSFMKVQSINESEINGLRYNEVFSRAIFPLGLGHTGNYVNYGAALIGDAAHRIHPLAGLGANLGFSDVKILTDKLEETLTNGDVLGSMTYLKEYESLSQCSNVGPLFMTHMLQRMFCNESQVLAAIRGLGLNVVNGIKPLKNLIQSAAANA